MAALKIGAVSDGMLAAGAVLIGGAALYLYFRGARGAASDAVQAAGNVVAGVADGVVSLGVSAGRATGQAFKDVSAATFEETQRKVENCDFGSTGSVFAVASASCVFKKFLNSMVWGGDAQPVKAANVQTAPGGGLWSPPEKTFSSIFTAPNDGSYWDTFERLSSPDAGNWVGVSVLPESNWWLKDLAPSSPVPIITSVPVNAQGATALFPVAGFRG